MREISKAEFDMAVETVDLYYEQIQKKVKAARGHKTDIFTWYQNLPVWMSARLCNILLPRWRASLPKGADHKFYRAEYSDRWPFKFVEDISKEKFLLIRNAGKKAWIELSELLEHYPPEKIIKQ